MAARLRPHATAASPEAVPVAGTAKPRSLKITDVERISRDTLAPNAPGIEANTQIEPDVAIDAHHPTTMTAVFQQGRNGPSGGSEDGGYATSHNGGRTWVDGNFPLLTTAVGGPLQLASDAAAAFGPDGSDYIQMIAFDQSNPRSTVAVQRSTDGGISFGPPSFVVDDHSGNVFNDKNWIAVDGFPGTRHYGRIYSVWSRFITSSVTHATNSPGAISWSDDQGKTWSPVHFITSRHAHTEGLIPLIHPDGSITVVYDQTAGGSDYETAQTSRDGGARWGKPARVGRFLGSEVPGMRTGGLPAAAIDAATGKLYVVWQDTRFNHAGLNDIVLSTSANGTAWTSPRRVNPKGAGLDRFTPAIAAVKGRVYISYRTRAKKGRAASVSEDLVTSTDGGKTFGPQSSIGPPSVLKWAAKDQESSQPVAFLGDYMGLAATAGEAEIVWCRSSRPPTGRYDQTTWGATVQR